MTNKISIFFITLIVMLGTANAAACEEVAFEELGILQGKVSIGPLCPVEPCNLPPEQATKVYEQRKVIVYDQRTKMKIAKLDLNEHGEFSLPLKAGHYLLDVTDGNGNELPLEQPRAVRGNLRSPRGIILKAGEKVQVTIDIDSGIR